MEDKTDLSYLNEIEEKELNESQSYILTETDNTVHQSIDKSNEIEYQKNVIFENSDEIIEDNTVHESLDDSNEIEDQAKEVLENSVEIIPEKSSPFEINTENETEIEGKSELVTDENNFESTIETNDENIEKSQANEASESNMSISEKYENQHDIDESIISFNELEKVDQSKESNKIVEESENIVNESETVSSNEINVNIDTIETEIEKEHDQENYENEISNSELKMNDENLNKEELLNNKIIEDKERVDHKDSSNQIGLCDEIVDASLESHQEPEITNKADDNLATKNKLDGISSFFTVHVQLDDGKIKNQIVTLVKPKGKKPFLGGYRHKLSGVEYHNAAVQTRPKPRPPPSVELFSRDTQTFQIRHQKVNTNNTTSSQMAKPGLYVSNVTDNLITPGKYETANEYQNRILKNIIIIQKYYRRWLAKHIVEEKRKQRNERLEWEQKEKESKMNEKQERIKKEYERRMHPKTRADFDLLYNGLEKWRQEQLARIDNSDKSLAIKKTEKLALLEEETDLLAAIDRHKIDRKQESKSEEVQKLLGKAAAPKSWKDNKGRKIQMDTPYTIRSRELLDILNSLNMQYLTQDERLDVLLTLKHTVKEHDCKLTRDIIDLVDREADLIMRNTKDSNLVGLRKRIITLFLQYCKTPTFNPEISLLLKVPPDPSVLIGDINYCRYCGRYLRSVEFSLSTKSSKLTICKSCARKENQSRKRQDYSHYRRILKDLQMDEQEINDESKIAFIFKQNDIKTLMEGVWDNKSILSECEDLDELVFIRWNFREHWSPWNTILLTKDEAEAHRKVINTSEIYSDIMINRINQKHVIARNMFDSLEKMVEKKNNLTKLTVKL